MSFSKQQLEKAATMRPEKLGAWFENNLKPIFKSMQEELPVYFHRFTDSKAAGDIVSDQPSDFLVRTPKGTFLIEAKASGKYQSLANGLSGLLSKEQAVHLRMWQRASPEPWDVYPFTSLVLFINVPSGNVEGWDGYFVGWYRSKGKRLGADERARGLVFSCHATELRPWLVEKLGVAEK